MSGFSGDKKIALAYWPGRGLMEVARVMLAIAGKFPGDYEDGRFSAPADNLEANLGRMPIITVTEGDKVTRIGQSLPIYYYVASECGLLGDSPLEAAQILAIVEHIKEMRTAFGKLDSDELKAAWFEGGSTDATGPADRAGMAQRYLPWWLGRIQAVPGLGEGGFAVGGKLSLADVLLFNALAEALRPEEIPEGGLMFGNGQPFGDAARSAAALAKYPKIKACVDSVANHPNVQKWLQIRGKQSF